MTVRDLSQTAGIRPGIHERSGAKRKDTAQQDVIYGVAGLLLFFTFIPIMLLIVLSL